MAVVAPSLSVPRSGDEQPGDQSAGYDEGRSAQIDHCDTVAGETVRRIACCLNDDWAHCLGCLRVAMRQGREDCYGYR